MLMSGFWSGRGSTLERSRLVGVNSWQGRCELKGSKKHRLRPLIELSGGNGGVFDELRWNSVYSSENKGLNVPTKGKETPLKSLESHSAYSHLKTIG